MVSFGIIFWRLGRAVRRRGVQGEECVGNALVCIAAIHRVAREAWAPRHMGG